MENREEIKPMLDVKFKPNMAIKFSYKKDKSEKIRKKEAETIPERWEITEDDH